ncbi:hypothetical protein A9505_06625 [Methanobrevibacter sp. A27]|nr:MULTISPECIES: hypothetical protein [Methanobrevibacter]OEC96548.1 hypothetical protein A9505_06625 [Methanobrevibacter sp. A27]
MVKRIQKKQYSVNCGTKLKDDEIKKTVIEPSVEENTYNNNQNIRSTTNTNTNNESWIECCLCLIGIFIIFAIIGSI